MLVITNGHKETIELGKKIGSELKENDILALYGPLGAGKTTLVQGIAEGLGVKDYVTSPTFILINEYQGRMPLYHIDLYRLDNIEDIRDLGIEEYFNKGGACLIEWAEKLGDLTPKNAKKIKLRIVEDQKREIEWEF